MCSFHGCCDSGIHSEHNTPNLRSGPTGPGTRRDLIFECSRQTTVSEPREVTRLSARPEQHRHHHRSDRHEHRHEPRSDPHRDQRHDQQRRDNTLNARSDNSMNCRASDPNLKKVHVVISGKVQGAHYRKWTVENATKLALNGWVRNGKDGTVEAVFSGKPNAVDHMVDKCRSGPSRARVANVEVTAAAGAPEKGFEQLDDKRW